jgi:hypothetical protein
MASYVVEAFLGDAIETGHNFLGDACDDILVSKRPDSYRTARSTDATLIIDYDLLAAMPAVPEIRSTVAQPSIPVNGEPTPRDSDLDELRKELRDIKKKLAEQETERIRPTTSSSPKSTPRSSP